MNNEKNKLLVPLNLIDINKMCFINNAACRYWDCSVTFKIQNGIRNCLIYNLIIVGMVGSMFLMFIVL